MEKPIRVQRKRTKGYKLPENTVCVTRGTPFGNPFKVETALDGLFFISCRIWNLVYIKRENCPDFYTHKFDAINGSIECFKIAMKDYRPAILSQLRGKNLACFCPLNQPCHADHLLEIANEPTPF